MSFYFAEKYARPVHARLEVPFARRNDFNDLFYLRRATLTFDVDWGVALNIKVVVRVYHEDGSLEQYIAHTDPINVKWDSHQRVTRDIFIHMQSKHQGRVTCVKFSYILHHEFRSVPSEYEYIFMDGADIALPGEQNRSISEQMPERNDYETVELSDWVLQNDVDWINNHYESLNLIPKFTKGQTWHPYHPKRFIHDHIDKVIWKKQADPAGLHAIKVCVDCIDDEDFCNHLLYAHECGVLVQVIVDWRKMTLTNSLNYLNLKRSGIELLGELCTTNDPLAEVATDMHNKFIIFDDEDSIIGSFNITFDQWGANWESGMTFHSQGMCRLLDNIFQAARGGVIQRYGIDPHSSFNLLYTFGRTAMMNGKYYRPHHAILAEINRAQHSINLCLFLIGELRGEHGDSVVDALIHAHQRGVAIRAIFNGHLAWQGDIRKPRSMEEELNRPLLPALQRLKDSGISIALVYGIFDRPIPYSPIHSKQCVIDGRIVIDGSFNWYNTSVLSHDLIVVVNNEGVAQHYLHEAQQILDTFRVFWLN
ncbi:MAG: phosphatidylserine/phosphatidylglycerophosphate/cardiolipin synthase family protein [Spartobacteria bacterium]|nr:phosphatidylserine/phosphatidylglycerophosphate/cardiolipin synthase family protein [Spartobacteria bacterium]